MNFVKLKNTKGDTLLVNLNNVSYIKEEEKSKSLFQICFNDGKDSELIPNTLDEFISDLESLGFDKKDK